MNIHRFIDIDTGEQFQYRDRYKYEDKRRKIEIYDTYNAEGQLIKQFIHLYRKKETIQLQLNFNGNNI